ncbi:hypothetical protein Anapl_11098 [Anas platyrhynchos]|uniref:Uncharacterized protein n=1 Tax=Anas platyrhynchos TaxID=8839 RepID=R0KFD4_ANAPL|nr:hypothetical protein Anapl_11098 [Anas platyrhynchos]
MRKHPQMCSEYPALPTQATCPLAFVLLSENTSALRTTREHPVPVGSVAQPQSDILPNSGLSEAVPSSRDSRSAISKETLMLILCTGLGSPPFPPASGLGWTST